MAGQIGREFLVKPQVPVKETTLLGITLLAGVIIIPRYTFHLRPIPQVRIIGDRKITAIRLHLKTTQGLLSLSHDGANFITRIDGGQIDTVSVNWSS